MKTLLLLMTLSILTPCSYSALEDLKDIIKDPVISRRCKALLSERSKKIRVQQRLNSMILRNKKLQDQLKPQQKVALQKLNLNKTQLKNNLRLTQIRVQAMEESIVRKGCPGITL
jgi:hypothetical protein